MLTWTLCDTKLFLFPFCVLFLSILSMFILMLFPLLSPLPSPLAIYHGLPTPASVLPTGPDRSPLTGAYAAEAYITLPAPYQHPTPDTI